MNRTLHTSHFTPQRQRESPATCLARSPARCSQRLCRFNTVRVARVDVPRLLFESLLLSQVVPRPRALVPHSHGSHSG